MYFPKCIFAKCTRLTHLLTFASLLLPKCCGSGDSNVSGESGNSGKSGESGDAPLEAFLVILCAFVAHF